MTATVPIVGREAGRGAEVRRRRATRGREGGGKLKVRRRSAFGCRQEAMISMQNGCCSARAGKPMRKSKSMSLLLGPPLFGCALVSKACQTSRNNNSCGWLTHRRVRRRKSSYLLECQLAPSSLSHLSIPS